MNGQRSMTARVVSVSVGENQAGARHVQLLALAAARNGVPFDQILIGADASEADCHLLVSEMARREDVFCVLLQRPLPAHLREDKLDAAIPPSKSFDTKRAAKPDAIMARIRECSEVSSRPDHPEQ